jgi:hypothetical protein
VVLHKRLEDQEWSPKAFFRLLYPAREPQCSFAILNASDQRREAPHRLQWPRMRPLLAETRTQIQDGLG